MDMHIQLRKERKLYILEFDFDFNFNFLFQYCYLFSVYILYTHTHVYVYIYVCKNLFTYMIYLFSPFSVFLYLLGQWLV